MARTVKEIKDSMTAVFIADVNIQAAYELDTTKTFDQQFSVVSIESIIFYIVAFCMWTLEVLFDTHRNEMDTLYEQHHAHTLNWYNNTAKAFMLGYELVPFEGVYNTDGMTTDEIAAAKIVTYAACVRFNRNNGRVFLRLKVAKGDDPTREPLSPTELEAFTNYMEAVQDAGVDLDCESRNPDHIKMHWVVYYDPQILDENGNRLDGSEDDVVRTAIKKYIQNLPFNGVYIPTYHIDALQQVQGVMLPQINSVETQIDGSAEWLPVGVTGMTADAGWYKFYNDTDLTITMEPFEPSENV